MIDEAKNLSQELERLRAENQALQEAYRAAQSDVERAENRVSTIFDTITDFYLRLDKDWRVIDVNSVGLKVMEKSAEQVIGKSVWELYPTAETGEWGRQYQRAMDSQRRVVFEIYTEPTSNWWEVHVLPSLDGLSVYLRDITGRKLAEQDLQASEARYRTLVENAPEAIVVFDADAGRFVDINDNAAQLFGLTREQLLSTGPIALSPDRQPDGTPSADAARSYMDRALQGDKPVFDWVHLDHVGEEILCEVRLVRLPPPDQKLLRGSVIDIRERRRLADDQAKLVAMVEHTRDAIGMADMEGRITYLNPAAIELAEIDDPNMVRSLTMWDLIAVEEHERFQTEVLPTLERLGSWHGESRMRSVTGELIDADFTGFLVRSSVTGEPLCMAGVVRDIRDEKRAQEQLAAAHKKLTFHVENSPLCVIEWDHDFRISRWSLQAEAVFGWKAEEVLGKHPDDWPFVHEDDSDAVRRTMQELVSGEPRNFSFNRNYTKSGAVVHCEWYNSILIDDSGKLISILSLVLDVSDRERLNERLLQAQKLESIGLLAGGVAHDFNNLLTAIIGYAELAEESVAADELTKGYLANVREAADRAARLTQQLLAFARRQVIEPKVVNLNNLIEEIAKLVRRLIGEDVELEFVPTWDLWQIRVDPSQMEQVLVNLAVNARDAMPHGGKLTIETRNVSLGNVDTPDPGVSTGGDYVMVAVSDTGYGMSEEVRGRVFEPFFTTKGMGTGLGLATCYGIVKQAGGTITVYSEAGLGTTFKIYFPRVDQPVEDAVVPNENAEIHGGTETILLVEDEPLVRSMAVTTLRSYGYTVLEAIDGIEALEVAGRYRGVISLVLTDIVMPRMGGKLLSTRIRETRSDIRVLFTSGYTNNALLNHGVLEPGVDLLAKPFTPGELVKRVRQVLDATRS